MAERILIAVDASSAARKAVEYAGRIFRNRPPAELEITLFHVVETLAPDAFPKARDPEVEKTVREAMSGWATRAAQEAEQLLDGYRRLLIDSGIPAETIHTKFRIHEGRPEAKRVAAALAILEEARGGYTTVVLGRLGVSNLPELYLGGVAEKVSRHLTGTTVWIVD